MLLLPMIWLERSNASDKDRRWEDDRVRAALHHASVMVVNGVRCRYTRNSENIQYRADSVV